MNPPIGIIGAGSFGTAIANLVAKNRDVLMFSRKPETVAGINDRHECFGQPMETCVSATYDAEELCTRCRLILPMVPSHAFRAMMQTFSAHLRPYHLLIHGTKGFDVTPPAEPDAPLTRKHIHTMSEVIRQESSVVRVGCLSGPNLAKEIMAGQPTASVVASSFDEVIQMGKDVLASDKFQVFGTYELLGAELAGALKNCIAIGSGLLAGRGYGKNLQALLINRGLMEMINFGRAFGTSPKAFLGTAGIGDLICTATSEKSRNFTFGYRLGRGETIEQLRERQVELAEGLRNLEIAVALSEHYNIVTPIFQILHRVVYGGLPVERAIGMLMRYPNYSDVDFL